MKTIAYVLAAVFAFGTFRGAAMETMSLDGLWEFRFERDKMMEGVQLPCFKANANSGTPDGSRSLLNLTGILQSSYDKRKGV
jgi:hypothetical protein